MTTFLAECYVSAANRPDDVAALMRGGAEAASGEGVDVTYVRSILIPGDETCFHVFEATSAEAVAAVGMRVAVPLIRVVEAVERPQKGERQ
jgi:hypothetical protein